MKLLKKVEEEGNPLVITKDGRTAGVLMSGEEYEGLMETLEILSDKQLLKQLKKADEDFRKGRLYTHEQVFKE
ncbi:MAG: type II toxin-antitoxin system Phd/YefM family antitoxin [Deltaproteobacteria bacterium]|nr:type II toxin-antitoxin system Phd/YefM family antitoxin [Deltaproteobacteria bacterium]